MIRAASRKRTTGKVAWFEITARAFFELLTSANDDRIGLSTDAAAALFDARRRVAATSAHAHASLRLRDCQMSTSSAIARSELPQGWRFSVHISKIRARSARCARISSMAIAAAIGSLHLNSGANK
jgi:hypothetical protein